MSEEVTKSPAVFAEKTFTDSGTPLVRVSVSRAQYGAAWTIESHGTDLAPVIELWAQLLETFGNESGYKIDSATRQLSRDAEFFRTKNAIKSSKKSGVR